MHKKFLQLLEQERAAIATADFDKIDALATSKQALFDQTLKLVKNKVALSEIQTALVRNQALFLAAIEGVSAARHRISAMREVRDNLRIYDQSGRIAQVASKAPDLSKRS